MWSSLEAVVGVLDNEMLVSAGITCTRRSEPAGGTTICESYIARPAPGDLSLIHI